MAPTDGRVVRPERRWGCRRGTPNLGDNGMVYFPQTSTVVQWPQFFCDNADTFELMTSYSALITLNTRSTQMCLLHITHASFVRDT